LVIFIKKTDGRPSGYSELATLPGRRHEPAGAGRQTVADDTRNDNEYHYIAPTIERHAATRAVTVQDQQAHRSLGYRPR
jgi:hypothetical protein